MHIGFGTSVAGAVLGLLGVLAWRDGDHGAASRALVQAFERALVAGDYASCVSNFGVTLAVLGSCERWDAVVRGDRALVTGRFPATLAAPALADVDRKKARRGS